MLLRKARWSDAKVLLRWKNDPVMRKYSIVSHDEIQLEDHMNWLMKHLWEIYIITDGQHDYGDIRLEGDDIAIKLDPDFRGQGVGTEAIKLAQEMREFLIAHIVTENLASLNLFTKCGFKFKSLQDGYYTLEWHK